MRDFKEVLGVCVASWNVIKDFARSQEMSIIKALDNEWADAVKISSLAKSVSPYPHQEEVRHKLEDLSVTGGLLVVEAPTAAGKTEAVAATFLDQLIRGEWWLAPRLVYTLPTKALSLTTYARLRAYARGVSLLAGVPELTVALEYGGILGAKHYLYGGVINTATLDAAVYGYVAVRFPGRATGNPRVSMPAGLLVTSLLVLDEI